MARHQHDGDVQYIPVPLPPQDPPKRPAWHKRVGRWVSRNRLWLWPLLAPVALLVTAHLAHAYGWGLWVLCGCLVVSSAVCMSAPDRWDRRAEVRYVRASAIGVGSWLSAAAFTGIRPPLLWTLAAGWVVWCAAGWWHKRVRRPDRHLGEWQEAWRLAAHRVRLGGSEVIDYIGDDQTDSILVALDRGRQSISHVRAALDDVLAAMEYPPEVTARTEQHPRNRSWVWVHLQHEDPLAEVQEWEEDLAPSSFLDPFTVGFTPDGGRITTSMSKAHWFVVGQTQWGKALSLETPVPTLHGWKTMGDIQPGDSLFDETGNPCRVTDAWPVLHGRPCYEVEFSDGSTIVADEGHQWLVDTRRSRISKSAQRHYLKRRPPKTADPSRWNHGQAHKRVLPEIVTTETMAASVRTADGKHANYSIPVALPLRCEDAVLPIPPYTLGAWLGDGTSLSGSVTSADREIISAIEAEGETVWQVPSTVKERHCLYRVESLTTRLRSLGVLGNKHIPMVYLRASEAQRRALLAGLLDTDGYCTRGGTTKFAVTSERLARDVQQLVTTLGYKATLRTKPARLRGKDCGTSWIVTFTTADEVFRLTRKLARLSITREHTRHRYITAVRPVPSVPVRCIAVDSPGRLFLVGEACIATHNSSELSLLTAQLSACDDTLIWFIDLKGGGTAAPWRPCIDWLATTHDEAELMLSAAKRIIAARSALTDDHIPSPEDPAIIIVIDEANEAFGQGTGRGALVALGVSVASLGAGLSVHLVVATQIGALYAVGDERIRSNLSKNLAFRCQQDSHAEYALGDWGSLKASKLDEKGKFYFKDQQKPSVLGRGYWLTRTQRARIARQNAGRRPVLPEALAMHAGEAYRTRHERSGTPHAPSPATRLESAVSTPEELAEQIEAGLPVDPPTPAEMQMVAEARAADGLPPLRAEDATTTGQDRFVAALTSGPHSPTDLIRISGMSKAWVAAYLAKLVEYGAVTQPAPRQPYQAVPGVDVRQAMDAIREERRRLEAKARELVDA